nr:PDZ domain-containing protein [Pareuzebyella sediminis]
MRSLGAVLPLFLLPIIIFGQTFNLPEGQKYEKVKFELINNLMIIPITVNGTELSFIFDSGVSNPILFNLSDKDSVQINDVTEIEIRGLGHNAPLKALSSKGNTFRLKKIENSSQSLYIVLDKSMNFSSTFGIPIHGIIGYQLFRDFVVDINYARRTIKFYDPEFYKRRERSTSQRLPLSVIKKKPYVDSNLFLKDAENLSVKLLVDTGSSDAIWLFEDDTIGIPEKSYTDFLGKGLNGDIFGKRTKVEGIKIGRFILEDAKAAFPDIKAMNSITNFGSRNGSIGGEVLKRFNIVFDYGQNSISFRKNRNYDDPFQYNLSGIDLEHNGMRYIAETIAEPKGVVLSDKNGFGNVQLLFDERTRLSLAPEIVVSGIRAGSPAARAGLREGDVILAVNGKDVKRYKLQEIFGILNEKEGKRIRLLIERYNSALTFTFVLKNMLK